nr:chromate transporter [Anoxybacter fermentans]
MIILQILLSLFLSFFKIGLFGFGGGYAMISLIQEELKSHGWLAIKDFINIIAIAEMTPGPIAINSATFVGFKVSSILGSIFATFGVITPSFILVIIVAHFFKKAQKSPYINAILKFLRPVVIGLILTAAFTISESSFIDLKSLIIGSAVFIVMLKTKVSPIFIIILSGLAGIILYG